MTTSPASVPDRQTHPASAAPVSSGLGSRVLGNLIVPVLILLGGGLLWGYVGGGWNQDRREALPPETKAAQPDPTHLMVTAEPITFRPVPRVVEAVGTLFGFEELVISAKVEGRVLRLHHEVSDRVAPDEILVELDPTDCRLAVDQAASNLQVELSKLGLLVPPDAKFDLTKVPTVMLAQAKVDNTQSKKDRTQRLATERAASTGELETAVSEFRTAQADHANQLLIAKSGLATIKLRQSALAVAEQQLADTKILVPTPHRPVPGQGDSITYVVTKRAVAEGTFLRAGGEICRLAIDKTLKLRVPVPERYSAQLQLGQQAEVYTAAFAEPFPGTVTLLNPTVDATTRTFEVEIQVANAHSQLKPGSFAKAIIQTSEAAAAPTVPLSALVTFAGVTKVFLVEGGKAKEVLVTPGVQTRQWVEIAQPALQPGGVVITSGQATLADSSPVSIRRQTPTASATESETSPDNALAHPSSSTQR